jgi:dTDP-4-amino-4,6-dideoxygalactose transaminase
VAEDVTHSQHLYVIRCSDREAVSGRLWQAGVSTAIHYPTPIHLQPAYGGEQRAGQFPEAEKAAKQVLSLPTFPELTEDELGAITAALAP